MADIKMFTDPNYCPARELDPQRLKEVKDARIKIASGAHGSEFGGPFEQSKQLCIMEATYYILYGGAGKISDAPPCTSQEIRNFMVSLNDTIESDRKRAMLKAVIPDIINTAPTVVNFAKYPSAPVKTFGSDKRYRAAESQRCAMILAWTEGRETAHASWEERVDSGYVTMTSVIEFIRELAAVAKFDKQNAETNAKLEEQR